MKEYFTIKNIKNILSKEEILRGNFGFEKEGLRITKDSKLALTPHPEIFGDKLKNPHITTDFSESQIEIVTPTFPSINKAYQCLSFLVDITNTSINEDEYIWNQSMPCILPDEDKIPIAKYEGKKGKESYNYRKKLANKYGTKKQMISGIHYNYSLNEDTIKKLHEKLAPERAYKNFKDGLYLKIARNYLQLKWFIIYITGATPAAHKTFTPESIELTNKKDKEDAYYSTEIISLRNSHIGYKNLEKLYPRYDTIKHFTQDVKTFIKEGKLSEAKELYSQIRLKAKNPEKYMESLEEDGIQYLEIRSIDINPFDKCGINKQDAEFIHIFLLYLLLKEDNQNPEYPEEGLYNEELIAEKGLNSKIKLMNSKKEISPKIWAEEIIEEIKNMNHELDLEKEEIISRIEERVKNSNKTYAYQLIKIIENMGFIKSQQQIAVNNKETSQELIDITTIKNNETLNEIYTKSIPNKK